MNTPLKSNDNGGNVVLPLAPIAKDATDNVRNEMEIYARFMRHLRLVPNSRIEIKILSAIQFTADMLDITDALVAKNLVDLGLRAPRKAFPSAYLEFADKSFLRKKWDLGSPCEGLSELRKHWDVTGEDKFAAFKHDVTVATQTTFIET